MDGQLSGGLGRLGLVLRGRIRLGGLRIAVVVVLLLPRYSRQRLGKGVFQAGRQGGGGGRELGRVLGGRDVVEQLQQGLVAQLLVLAVGCLGWWWKGGRGRRGGEGARSILECKLRVVGLKGYREKSSVCRVQGSVPGVQGEEFSAWGTGLGVMRRVQGMAGGGMHGVADVVVCATVLYRAWRVWCGVV